MNVLLVCLSYVLKTYAHVIIVLVSEFAHEIIVLVSGFAHVIIVLICGKSGMYYLYVLDHILSTLD